MFGAKVHESSITGPVGVVIDKSLSPLDKLSHLGFPGI